MKPVSDYKPIDLHAAIDLIRSGELDFGSPIAIREDESHEWQKDWLQQLHVFADYPFETTDDNWWPYAALIIERMPNEVPDGLPPLPEPWLAYVGKGPLHNADSAAKTVIWAYDGNSKWFPCGYGRVESVHYAIDVRSAYARLHYPELVEAMEYKKPLKLEVGKWYITKNGVIGQLERNESKRYPYLLCGYSYTEEGHHEYGDNSGLDIDREVKVTELDGSPVD